MSTLVLVRHGQASFASRNYDQLSETGIRQSRCLGEHWCRVAPRFEAAYSGTLQRQLHTAQHAFACLPSPIEARPLPPFDEYDHTEIIRAYLPLVAREHPELGLEVDSRKELFGDRRKFQEFFEKVTACWIQARECDPPLRESWLDFRARVLEGLRAIARRDATVVAFTSGGVISVAMQEALGLTAERAFTVNWRIYNASVHTFRVGRRGLALMGFNNVAHLELKNDPDLFTFR